MNGAHVVASSGVTSALAAVIVWVSACLEKGQLLQVNTETSVALATLIITCLGGGTLAALKSRATAKESVSVETTTTTTPAPKVTP